MLAVGSLALASHASDDLTSGGWLDNTSESATVSERLAGEFGAGRSSLIALFRSDASTDAASPEFQAAIDATLRGLAGDDRVAGVVGFAQTGDRRFISTDGDSAYVLVQLNLSDEESVDQFETLREKIVPPAGTTVALTGYGPLTKDSAEASEQDLQRAETVSLPIAAVILIVVFASLLAAGLPLLVAGLAIPSSLALIFLVSQQVEMSIYVLNIATMLGLALAIDYSLFLVSRFREELRRGRTVGDAVERAVATSGKAVAFSGLAVGIGLSGLMLFEAPAIVSIGISGALVVLCSVFYALTFLPAVLGMLGHRVNSLSLRALDRRDPAPPRLGDGRGGRRSGQPPVGASRARRDGAPDDRRGQRARVPAARGPAVPADRAGRARCIGHAGRPREPRRLRRDPGRVPARRDHPDHHPRDGRRRSDDARERARPGAVRGRRARHRRASTASKGRSASRTRRPANR